MAKSWEKSEFNKLLPVLVAAYPQTFFGKDSPDTKPLKIGIDLDLRQRHPDIARGRIYRFLNIYSGKNRYLTAIVERRPRVDLDGNECGLVTDCQHEYAATSMRKRTEAANAVA